MAMEESSGTRPYTWLFRPCTDLSSPKDGSPSLTLTSVQIQKHTSYKETTKFMDFSTIAPSQEDADALVAMVRELNTVAGLEQLDEAAVKNLAYTARGNLAPMNAFIGGLAAQEVIKVGLKPGHRLHRSVVAACCSCLRFPTGVQQNIHSSEAVAVFRCT